MLTTRCNHPRYLHCIHCIPTHAVAQSLLDQADGAQAYRMAPRCRVKDCGHKATREDGLCLRCGEEADALNRGDTADWPAGLGKWLCWLIIGGSIIVIVSQVYMWLTNTRGVF